MLSAFRFPRRLGQHFSGVVGGGDPKPLRGQKTGNGPRAAAQIKDMFCLKGPQATQQIGGPPAVGGVFHQPVIASGKPLVGPHCSRPFILAKSWAYAPVP